MKNYKLFVARYRKLPEDIRYSFYDSDAKELLILTENDPPSGFIPVPDSHLSFLTKSEQTWLLACKLKLNGEALRENEKEFSEYMELFLETLEKALNELKRKEKGGYDGKNGKENESELICAFDTAL